MRQKRRAVAAARFRRRLGLAGALASVGVLVGALPAWAAPPTYGNRSSCQLPLKSGSVSIQSFAAHKVTVTYEECGGFPTSQRPAAHIHIPWQVAYVSLLVTAPSTNPGSFVEDITIDDGKWFSINNGYDRRYSFTIHHKVIKVGSSTFDAHVDATIDDAYGITFCFGRTCKKG